jgi:hypothetical protein
VLALFWWLVPSFPANVLLFKALNACFLAAAAAGVATFARNRLGFSRPASAAIAVAGCVAIPTLTLSSMLLSEPLFLAVLMFGLPMIERVVDGDSRARSLILSGLAAGVSTLVRTLGIALVAGVVLALIVRRRMRDAALAAAAAVAAIAPWQIWVAVHDDSVPPALRGIYASYGAWYAEGLRAEGPSLVWRTLEKSAGEVFGMFATLAAVSLPMAVRIVLLAGLLALFVLGARRMWSSAPVTALFLAFYVLIVMVWPFGPARFFMGIWPILVLLAATGAREAWSWTPRPYGWRALRYATLAVAAILAFSHLRYNVRGYRGGWWSSIPRMQTRIIQPIVIWARNRARPDEVLATSAGTMVYLYSGRLAVPAHAFTVQDYFRPASVEEKEKTLRAILSAYDVGAVAVVADAALMRAAQAMASSDPPELVPRDTLVNGLVFAPVRPIDPKLTTSTR